jgi:acyl-CoA synthetase (AMP-forming)/AMP-acid ligase II
MPDKRGQRLMTTDQRFMTNGARSAVDLHSPFDGLHSNLVALTRTRAAQKGEAIAYTFLLDGDGRETHITYAELDRRARTVAARLQQELRPGDRAILVFPTGPDFVATFLGCLYARVIAVPVPEPFTDRHFLRIRNIVVDAGTRHILTTSRFLTAVNQRFADNPEIQALRWLATDTLEQAGADAWQQQSIAPDDVAFLQYTSGSTAEPKGVILTHRNLQTNLEMARQFYQSDEETLFVSWLPLFHDLGLIAKLAHTIYVGSRCILMSPFAFLQKPVRWLQAISSYQGDISGGPDFAYAITARKVTPEQKAGLDLSSWRLAFTGAEPVRPATLERFADAFRECGFRREALTPGFGMAEATLFIAGGPIDQGPIYYRIDAAAFARDRVVPAKAGGAAVTAVACGRFDWLDQQLKIVNPDTLRECAPDEVGEIWLAGSHIARGYWNKPAETEAAFHAYTADSGAGPFMRTGDLGFVHEGQLYIGGRIKDLIIIDGQNHYPQDIEFTVENAHPAVRSGCTAAFSIDRDGQERLVVVAELRNPSESDTAWDIPVVAQELQRAVSKEHGIPLYDIAFIKPRTIHKTSSGKIQRRACRADYLADLLSVY